MFKHLEKTIDQLALRQSKFLEQKDQLLRLPKSTTPQQKLERAMRYEHLLAKISELEHTIEHLLHALNFDRLEVDLRNQDRRRNRDRRQLSKTVV